MDLDQIPSDALEQLIAGSGGASVTDTVAAWLSDLRARPGSYPSLTTSDAFYVYQRWCEARGHVPLQPFTFARLMGMRFRKIHARLGHKTTRFFGMDKATAGQLRHEYKTHPTPPEVSARFTFAELKKDHSKDP